MTSDACEKIYQIFADLRHKLTTFNKRQDVI